MQTMYPAVVNSPETVTLGAIAPTDTTVTVQDITKIPAPPNLLVIGGDRPDAETVLLTAVVGSTLTIQRAINGIARTWADRTTIARNFTAYDHDAFKANIEELNTNKLATTGNGSNVTATFSQAGTRVNIASGEKLSVILGKIMKWLADLGAAAWMGTGTTASTVALGNHIHTAAAVGAVPTSRKVNGKALSEDVTLAAPDVGARPDDWLPTLPEVGGSRVQMLDNAYWAVPSVIVTQRGVTPHTTGYGIDRWYLENSGTGTLSVTSNGLVLTASGGINRFNQKLETWETGQRVSFSLLMNSIVGSGFLNILGHNGTEWVPAGNINFDSSNKLVQVSGIVPTGITNLITRIGAYDGSTITMIASKLEAGEGQTLAHQDANGNWVLNDPPPKPAAELLECKRYYRLWTTEAARTEALKEVGLMRLASPTTGTTVISGTTYYYASAES